MVSFFLLCLHFLLEIFNSPPWHFCLSRMALTQTLTVPWRLGWEEDEKGKTEESTDVSLVTCEDGWDTSVLFFCLEVLSQSLTQDGIHTPCSRSAEP